ncbi:MAG: hypothetical protein RL768_1460 [Nitrospirota bacterium]|jgi:hypothetical protein
MLDGIEIPDMTLYLVAVLALLVIWQYYQMQIMAGRILAVDIFDRSGIRMYFFVTPDDDHVCEVCSVATGRVFSSSQVAKQSFTPLNGTCKRAVPCASVLVGLYGGWLEARGVLERVRANFKRRKGVQLSPEELRAMVNGQWERSISADTDRLGIHIIEAMCYEKVNPQVAVSGYRFVVDQAKEIRHLMLLVPAYLRLTQLLIRSGEAAEALELVERFEARFPTNKRGPHFPSEEQREMMRTKKTQLLKGLPLKMPA